MTTQKTNLEQVSEILKPLGISFEVIVGAVAEVADQVLSKRLQELNANLDMKVTHAIDQKAPDIAKRVVAEIRKQIEGSHPVQNGASPVSTETSGGLLPLLALFMKMLGGGGGDNFGGSITQMAQMSQAMGTMMRNIIEPVADIWAMGRGSLLKEMETRYKVGMEPISTQSASLARKVRVK